MLTAAQVWYIAKVYPEPTTPQEAEATPEYKTLSQDDLAYWATAALVLQRLADARVVPRR